MNFGRRFNIPKFNFRNRTSAPFSNWRRSGYDLIYEKKNLDFDFRFKHFAYAYAGIATANFLYLTGRDMLDPSPKTGSRKTHGKIGIVSLNATIPNNITGKMLESVMFPFALIGMMNEVEEPKPKQKPKREIKQEPEQEIKQEPEQEQNKN
jgi:hypothetical protein